MSGKKKRKRKKSPTVAIATIELFLAATMLVKFLHNCHQQGLI